MGVSLLERSSRDTASASLRGSAALAGVSACRVLKILAKRDRHMSHRRRLRTEMITGCGLQRSPRTRTPFSVLPQKRTQTTNEELVKKISTKIFPAPARSALAHSIAQPEVLCRTGRTEAEGLVEGRKPGAFCPPALLPLSRHPLSPPPPYPYISVYSYASQVKSTN